MGTSNGMEITPAEMKERLDRGENFLFVDVRAPWEYELCPVDGAKLIPMGSIQENLQALDVDKDVVCYCHHGMRSMDVAAWMRGQGVQRAKSLAGGTERWSLEIDPRVPRY